MEFWIWFLFCKILVVAAQLETEVKIYKEEDVNYETAGDWCRTTLNGSMANQDAAKSALRAVDTSSALEIGFIWYRNNLTSIEALNCEVDWCKNGGVCITNDTQKTCLCRDGYQGEHCENENCFLKGCQNNGICIRNGDSRTCHCRDNFHGQFCESEGCTENRCFNGGTCQFTEAGAYCLCTEPYFGRFCDRSKMDVEFKGCYGDNADRILEMSAYEIAELTPFKCFAKCALLGKRYSGVEYGTECFCGNNIKGNYSILPKSSCNTKCSGDNSQNCGGSWAIDIYDIARVNGLSETVTEDNNSCSFDPDDPCFLGINTVGGRQWKTVLSAERGLRYYVEFARRRSETELWDVAFMTWSASPLQGPKCVTFQYSVNSRNGGGISVYQQSDDDVITASFLMRVYSNTGGRWRKASLQILPFLFGTIIIAGSLRNEDSNIRIADIILEEGYCGCPSTTCFPGLIKKPVTGTGCIDNCTAFAPVEGTMGILKCTFNQNLPCFMTSIGGIWKTKSLTQNFHVLQLNSKDGVEVSDTFRSIRLPQGRWFCFSFRSLKFANSSLAVIFENDNYRKTLLSAELLSGDQLVMNPRIEFISGNNSTISIQGDVGGDINDGIYITEIQIEEGGCSPDVRSFASNTTYVQPAGMVNTTVRPSTTINDWTIQVDEGSRIHIDIPLFVPSSIQTQCPYGYFEVLNRTKDVITKTCGESVKVNDNVVTLRLRKDNTRIRLNVLFRWRSEASVCSSMYKSGNLLETVEIPCRSPLNAIACEFQRKKDIAENPEITTQKGNPGIENPQGNSKELLIVMSVLILCLLGVVCVIAIIILRRRRARSTRTSLTISNEMYMYNRVTSPEDKKGKHHTAIEASNEPDSKKKVMLYHNEMFGSEPDSKTSGLPGEEMGSTRNKALGEDYDHLAFRGSSNMNIQGKKRGNYPEENEYSTSRYIPDTASNRGANMDDPHDTYSHVSMSHEGLVQRRYTDKSFDDPQDMYSHASVAPELLDGGIQDQGYMCPKTHSNGTTPGRLLDLEDDVYANTARQ